MNRADEYDSGDCNDTERPPLQRSESVDEEVTRRIRLRKCNTYLLDCIDVTSALDHLLENDIIQTHDQQKIESKATDNEKRREILNIVEKKHGAFEVFLKSQSDFIREKLENVPVNENEKLKAKVMIEEVLAKHLQEQFKESKGTLLPKDTIFDCIRLILLKEGVHCYDNEIWMETVVLQTFTTAAVDKESRSLRNKFRNLSLSTNTDKDTPQESDEVDSDDVDGDLNTAQVSFENTDFYLRNEFRIVLIGRTGVGKSATGNTILGEVAFTSCYSPKSVTNKCNFKKAKRFERDYLVVDTPGFFDTHASNETIKKEIEKCAAITAPGVHAFVFVMEPGRFTQQERESIQLMEDVFGSEMYNHMIIVFTKKDDLDRKKTNIDKFVSESDDHFKTFLQKCDSRFLAIANEQEDSDEHAKRLHHKILALTARNKHAHFSNYLFDDAEKVYIERTSCLRQAYAKEANTIIVKKCKIKENNKLKQRNKELEQIKKEQAATINNYEDLFQKFRDEQRNQKSEECSSCIQM